MLVTRRLRFEMAAGDRVFSNPGREDNYSTPEPFPTITDIRVEPVLTDLFGVQMRWWSAAHGVVTDFPRWDPLERDGRLDDPEWWPVGSASQPFFDAEQNWVFRCWEDEGFVYVPGGLRLVSWERRFRVPRDVFIAAWRDGVRRIKASVPPSAGRTP